MQDHGQDHGPVGSTDVGLQHGGLGFNSNEQLLHQNKKKMQQKGVTASGEVE